MSVSKDQPLAFYVQVANALKEDILTGKFERGERIGSQKALEERFSVSKITIRKAIEVLESEDLVTTIHGKGTFVKQDKVEQELGALTSLTDVIKMHGYNPQVKVIRKEDRTTTATFSENEYDKKIDCMYIERVHIIEDETIALAQAYIPNTYGQSLSKTELEQNTIYELLEDKFKMTLGEADQSIEAVPADEYLSEVLKVDTGTPLLKAQRLVFNSSNEFVEKIIFYYRHDTFAFKVKLNSMSITPMWPTK